MRKTLHKDIISQATKLTGYINDAAHGFNPDTIHELRTGSKNFGHCSGATGKQTAV